MDKDLKDVLTYGLGTIITYSLLIGFISSLTKDIHLIIIYTCLVTIFMCLWYFKIKISKLLKEEKEDKNDKE